VVDDNGEGDDNSRHGDAKAGPDEGFGKAKESAEDEEDDVDDGDGGRQQLHHDRASVRAVQALNVQVLLLCRLKKGF
jgi:hypothetical protein